MTRQCYPCPQLDPYNNQRVIGSEDCLCLNIYAPKMPGEEEGKQTLLLNQVKRLFSIVVTSKILEKGKQRASLCGHVTVLVVVAIQVEKPGCFKN